MTIRLLYHGPLWAGSTSLQLYEGFSGVDGVEAIASDDLLRVGKLENPIHRVRWKLRWPADTTGSNEILLEAVGRHRPDIVVVDSSKVLRRSTLQRIREVCQPRLVYYTPDDIMATHNLSRTLRWSFADWDVFFTTKTFNVEELRRAGVRRPLLVGNAFDPILNAPMTKEEVGDEFEAFDCVFIGMYEAARCRSINALAAAGLSVVVYGAGPGEWHARSLHPSIVLRSSVYAREYRRAWHVGKLALSFLRKLNRDQITTRTLEVAAIGRPMLSEKTDEIDAYFADGKEYLGFSNDAQLVALAREWLLRDSDRLRLSRAARQRCLTSGYSYRERAGWMVERIMETDPA
jgi:spore maturation protein CgeB